MKQRTNSTQTVRQSAALLLMTRLTAFFLCYAPYSAAYAAGTVLAAALTGVVLLLLLRIRQRKLPLFRKIFGLLALLWALLLAYRFFRLLHALHAPHLPLTAVLFLLTVLFTLTRPQAASGRLALLLLILAGAALLLLPVSGYRTAHLLPLFAPDSLSAGFLRELLQSGDLLLLPVIAERLNSDRLSLRRVIGFRTLFCCTVLPLAVLFGTMQNGRLRGFGENPFFLLLSRTPLTDTVRTDGFWLMLAAVCTALSVTAFLQTFGLNKVRSF